MATRSQQPPEARQRRRAEEVAEQGTQVPTPASQPRSPSQVGSQASDDSQTVVLSHSDAREERAASTSSPEEESLHCWICLMDEPITEREAGHWKEPCSCNLTAHEECLFQWIASQEDNQKIECPQCKTRINISEPLDYFIQFASIIRRSAGYCLVPAGVMAILGIGYTGLLVYGQNTVTLIFGEEEASKIFYSAVSRSHPVKHIRGNSLWDIFRRSMAEAEEISQTFAKHFVALACPFFPDLQGKMNWQCLVSLPAIAPSLVLSRLHLADELITLLPAAYSVFQILNRQPKDVMEWPPSPGLTLAALPFIRICYTETYKYFFQDLEKKWNQAVQRQPREGETAEEVAEAEEAREVRHELELGMELMPDEDEDTDEEDAEIRGDQDQHPPDAERQAQLLNIIQDRLDLQDAENAADLAREVGLHNLQDNLQFGQPALDVARENLNQGRPELNVGEPEPNARQEPVEQRVNALEARLNIVTDGLATSVFGALFFPAISWAMGNLIKNTFPKTWIREPYVLRSWRSTEKLSWSRGFLQSQFGRSIAGGCLFIVLKDAAVLYYKYKRAKDVGKRRILNYGERDDARTAK